MNPSYSLSEKIWEQTLKQIDEYKVALKVWCPVCGHHSGSLCSTGEDWRAKPHAARLARARLKEIK